MWLVGISGDSPTQSRTDCYCHPGQLTSFSGNLLHCFATITLQESFPLKLKPCFIPYKHAGQIFPFICATVYHIVSRIFSSFFFFLKAKKPQFFYPSFRGLVSSCPSPSCSVKSSYFSCVILEAQLSGLQTVWQHHELPLPEGWDLSIHQESQEGHFLNYGTGITF